MVDSVNKRFQVYVREDVAHNIFQFGQEINPEFTGPPDNEIPEEWINILNSRLQIIDRRIGNLGGEIGIYAGQNLTEISHVKKTFIILHENVTTPTSVDDTAVIISSRRMDFTRSKVLIKTTEPFTLIFAESYDPLWVAYVNGEKLQSIPLYGIINGFWINQTGTLEITIEYEPQKWFYYGSIISVNTLIACATYLLYDWTKDKALLERLKKRLKPILKRKTTHRELRRMEIMEE